MIVNGEYRPAKGQTVSELLADLGLQADQVVVEVDGEILTRSDFASRVPEEEAKVEVVSFVGGG